MASLPKIVALYKTFCGPEFVEASLASIYPHVDSIVMVHSAVGWDKSTGNRVQALAEAWTKKHDTEHKIKHVYTSVAEQVAQYALGLGHVARLKPDFVLLVDTDEIWDGDILAEAKVRLASADPRFMRFTCGMKTYVKSPLYRVHPAEFCQPTAFLRFTPDTVRYGLTGPRGNNVKPTQHWDDIYFHHFTYVRETEEDVFKKIRTSHIGDGCQTRELRSWQAECWDLLPYALHFHTTNGSENSWSRCIELAVDELPAGLRQHSLVVRWAERQQRELLRTPPVSIIIPTCKKLADVAALVDEIQRRSTGTFEIIPTCQVGVSASVNRNHGLDAAQYDHIVMLDDDILDLSYGWNQRMIRSISGDVVMVSARLFKPNGAPGHLMGKAAMVAGEVTLAAERKLATACVAFRKTTMRFDTGFIGSGFEDDDYCMQLLAENKDAQFVVDNTVLVTHQNEKKNQEGPYHRHNSQYFANKWRPVCTAQ